MRKSGSKIRSLRVLHSIIEKKKTQSSQRIVFCFGVFDLVHPGHIRLFESAKNHGDTLVVGVVADSYVRKGPGRPVYGQNLRAEFLATFEIVDYVTIITSSSARQALEVLRPDVYYRGNQLSKAKHSTAELTRLKREESTAKRLGVEVLSHDERVVFSSSRIISDHLQVHPPETKKYLDAFSRTYTKENILEKLQDLKKAKVLMLGDAIVDQYYYCSPLGKSSKEPVMVHQYMRDESYIGGILATTNHITSVLERPSLLTLLGKKKSFESFIKKKLRPSVSAMFAKHPGNTIIKRRFLDIHTNQKLFQMSYLEDDFTMDTQIEDQILAVLKRKLPSHDFVVVNDFGHGLMTERIINYVCEHAKFIALNVQANSANFGFNVVTKYPRADFVCIDKQELQLATQDKGREVEELMKEVFKKLKCSFLIVTTGPNGSISYSRKHGATYAPALSDKIVDRVGAGDAFFALTAPCAWAGLPDDVISFIGNVAGALKVQVIGNKKQISYDELESFILQLLQ